MANYKELYNKLKKEVNDDFGTKFTKGVLSYTKVKEDLNNAKDHKVRYRVIFNDVEDDFFVQYEKHFFKIGSSWKSVLCFNKTSGYICPLCDFIDNNKKALDKPLQYKSKVNFNLLVFNYRSKKLEKLSVNNQEMMIILNKVFDSDIELSENKVDGFDVYYTLNDNGYQDILTVKVPDLSLEKLLENRKDDVDINVAMREVYNDVNPSDTSFFYKSAVNILELLINTNCPDLSHLTDKYNKKLKEDKNNSPKNKKDNDDEEEENESTNVVIFDEDDQLNNDKNDSEDDDKPLNTNKTGSAKIGSKKPQNTKKEDVEKEQPKEDELDLDQLDMELGL